MVARRKLLKNLFLIDGVSGTGKSDLVEYATSSHNRCGVLIKATNRELREYEIEKQQFLDLDFYSNDDFESLDLDYEYEYLGRKYGFNKTQLDQCLHKHRNVFAIIRNVPLMSELKATYAHCKVIAVYVHSDLRLIEDRLRLQGRTEIQIEFRLSRINEVFADYVRNSNFFDEIIVNTSNRRDYYTLIDNLIMKYSTEK